MGYLPPEVRADIWEHVLFSNPSDSDCVVNDFDHKTLRRDLTYGCAKACNEHWRYTWNSYGKKYTNPHFYHMLEDVFGAAIIEILSTFFRRCQFCFSSAKDLERFLDEFPRRHAVSIIVRPLTAICVQRNHLWEGWCNCKSADEDRAWLGVLQRLPSFVISVTFPLGDKVRCSLSKSKLQKMLNTMDALNKTVIRTSPKVATSVSFNEKGDPHDERYQARKDAFRAVIRDIER